MLPVGIDVGIATNREHRMKTFFMPARNRILGASRIEMPTANEVEAMSTGPPVGPLYTEVGENAVPQKVTQFSPLGGRVSRPSCRGLRPPLECGGLLYRSEFFKSKTVNRITPG